MTAEQQPELPDDAQKQIVDLAKDMTLSALFPTAVDVGSAHAIAQGLRDLVDSGRITGQQADEARRLITGIRVLV